MHTHACTHSKYSNRIELLIGAIGGYSMPLLPALHSFEEELGEGDKRY